MPIEASAVPGRPGMGSGSAGFSVKRTTRLNSVTDSTPYSRARSRGTSTTPTVMSACFST